MIVGQSVSGCTYSMHEYKASIKANTLPKLWFVLGHSHIPCRFPISDTKLDGQIGSMHCSYFGCLWFKPRQAVRPPCLRIVQPELRPDCLHPRSSNYAETLSLNKTAECVLQYSLLACDAVYILDPTGMRFGEIGCLRFQGWILSEE